MSWVRCNKCFKSKLLNPELVLYVTSCFHILCQSCLQKVCSICKKTFRAVLINETMPNNIKFYFQNSEVLTQNLQKAIKFQFDQSSIYEINNVNAFSKVIKLKNLKERIQKYGNFRLQKLKSLSEEIIQIKNKYSKLQMAKERQAVKQQFINTTMSKSLDKSLNSYNDSRNKSSIIPPSSASRSFTPSGLIGEPNLNLSSRHQTSRKFFDDQSSFSVSSAKSGYYDRNKEFRITPRNTFITRNVQSLKGININPRSRKYEGKYSQNVHNSKFFK